MSGITRKQVIGYTVLPGIRPRLQTLFTKGFSYIAFFIALVYQAGRLLPANHPYTDPNNVGKFGLRHVIAEAANNLQLDKKNLDQVILFITIMLGLGLIFLQIILLGLALFFQPALAQMPTNFAGFFLTPEPSQDLAHMFLDMVFGVPGVAPGTASFFESCVASAEVCRDTDGVNVVDANNNWILSDIGFPFPIHEGLHQMFQLYSIGLLVVAAMITSYFIATILAETMQTGTAFGKRFNKVWAPLRIVVAFGLLVPVGVGFNASQYIVLYAAKFGSGFATNGWNIFNETLEESPLGDTENLVSQPNVPEIGGLLQFMYTARVCAELEALFNQRTIRAYIIRESSESPSFIDINYVEYPQLITFLNGSKQAIIRFGFRDDSNPIDGDDGVSSQNPGFKAGIRPICGELIMPLTDPRDPANTGSTDPGTQGPEPGPRIMQEYYWYVIFELWDIVFDLDSNDPNANPPTPNEQLPDAFTNRNRYPWNYPWNVTRLYTSWDAKPNLPEPPPEYKTDVQDFYIRDLEAAMVDPALTGIDAIIGGEGAIPAQMDATGWSTDPGTGTPNPILEKGWGAAGIWYNKVAELNGSVTNSVVNVPYPSKYPEVMEFIYLKKRQQDQNVPMETRFKPVLAGKQDVLHRASEHQQMAVALWEGFNYWQKGGFTSTTQTTPTKNYFKDAISALFGTEGLFNMQKNQDVHPLAQLVGVGKSLVTASVASLSGAAISGAGGGLLSLIFSEAGPVSKMLVSFFMMIATTTLTAGFILYYIVPFLPFIYFFFAVGGWVKGIFEAMVGAPLWALAHIRIDGNGLPGQAAVSGYFLIFEIFLRPILIVFGLLASISIFAAMLSVLNETWDLVTSNLAGFDARTEITGVYRTADGTQAAITELDDKRGPIDMFFFTIVYTIVAYLMAMSSFKLIDLIPDNILRWMGQSISSFNDQREDPTQGLVGTAYIGGSSAIGSVGGGVENVLKGMSKGKG